MVSGHTGNVVASSKNAGKNEEIRQGAVHAQKAAQIDAESGALAAALKTLPPAIRDAILALVKAAGG